MNIFDFNVGDYVVLDCPSYDGFDPTDLYMVKNVEKSRIMIDNLIRGFQWIGENGPKELSRWPEGTQFRKAYNLEIVLGLIYHSNERICFFDHKIPEPTASDKAVGLLLGKYIDDVKNFPLDDYFHKAFRQIDVIRESRMDDIVHTLLNDAPLFWYYFDKFKDE